MQTQLFFCTPEEVVKADNSSFRESLRVIADTDASKYMFEIISAMNVDKW